MWFVEECEIWTKEAIIGDRIGGEMWRPSVRQTVRASRSTIFFHFIRASTHLAYATPSRTQQAVFLVE